MLVMLLFFLNMLNYIVLFNWSYDIILQEKNITCLIKSISFTAQFLFGLFYAESQKCLYVLANFLVRQFLRDNKAIWN